MCQPAKAANEQAGAGASIVHTATTSVLSPCPRQQHTTTFSRPAYNAPDVPCAPYAPYVALAALSSHITHVLALRFRNRLLIPVPLVFYAHPTRVSAADMSLELDPPELGFRRVSPMSTRINFVSMLIVSDPGPFTHEVSQILVLRNPNSDPVAFKVGELRQGPRFPAGEAQLTHFFI
jgi:hypothetical protein